MVGNAPRGFGQRAVQMVAMCRAEPGLLRAPHTLTNTEAQPYRDRPSQSKVPRAAVSTPPGPAQERSLPMHDERTEAPSTAAEQDRTMQAALLASVMAHHPLQLTQGELIRDMARDPDDFAERDNVNRAIRDLVRAGLLHRHGSFVLPTVAAVVAHRLFAL